MYATAYKLDPMSIMGDIRLQQPKQHSGHPVPAELAPQASQRHPDALIREASACMKPTSIGLLQEYAARTQ
jgi:hypothetical protein